MKKSSNKKTIYGYVRCETKHCANNLLQMMIRYGLKDDIICELDEIMVAAQGTSH